MGVMGMAVKRVKAHFGQEAELRSQRGSFAERAPPSQEQGIGTHIVMGASPILSIYGMLQNTEDQCV